MLFKVHYYRITLLHYIDASLENNKKAPLLMTSGCMASLHRTKHIANMHIHVQIYKGV